jgi:aminopeptidase YwaD
LLHHISKMKKIFFLLTVISLTAHAQKSKKAAAKADNAIIANLQMHVGYLADDKLEGRRTGTAGEKLAYEYITGEFAKIGLQPKGDNGTYIQPFEVNEGRQVNPSTHLIVNGNDLVQGKEFFPFNFSPNSSLEATPTIAVQEMGNIWFWDLKELLEQHKTNPHFDLADAIKTKITDVTGKSATALIIYNTSGIDDGLKFEGKLKPEFTKIPVLYVSKAAKEKYLKDESAILDVKLKVDIGEKKRQGHNVAGYIDNGAATTIIIGAHYDHLGYGEDHNSLYAGTTPMIHNGADDNASGTAALIEMARMLSASKLKNSNYLFLAFSGEELGLYGSKYFTEHPSISMSNVNYMINMDMVGRLNDSSRAITVGGYGTSPAWGELLTSNKLLTIKTDSSGAGPSDHTSFYRKDIPVLFFFTGTHTDYHKPGDDADKINHAGQLLVIKYIYNIIEATQKRDKLAFLKTREQTMAKTSFKVTMGLMLDYTYSGGDGIKVDGVSDNRPAQKAGIKAGDIITQLGDFKFADVNDYMKALGKFNKGETTKAKLKRGNEELTVEITFAP